MGEGLYDFFNEGNLVRVELGSFLFTAPLHPMEVLQDDSELDEELEQKILELQERYGVLQGIQALDPIYFGLDVGFEEVSDAKLKEDTFDGGHSPLEDGLDFWPIRVQIGIDELIIIVQPVIEVILQDLD